MLIQHWNGTPQELERLCRAIELTCGCARPPEAPGPTCPAHALLTSQTTLNHRLFVYPTRATFSTASSSPTDQRVIAAVVLGLGGVLFLAVAVRLAADN